MYYFVVVVVVVGVGVLLLEFCCWSFVVLFFVNDDRSMIMIERLNRSFSGGRNPNSECRIFNPLCTVTHEHEQHQESYQEGKVPVLYNMLINDEEE